MDNAEVNSVPLAPLTALRKMGKDAKKGKGQKMFKKSSKKNPKKAPEGIGAGPRRRRKKVTESYAIYVFKVLKQIHPECSISKRGMQIMNSFMNDIFDRAATEAVRLLRSSRKRTLSS